MKATNEMETSTSGNPKPVTFDTLSAAQGLREIGFDHNQAEGVVTTISAAVSQTVATKADLALVHKDNALVRKDVDRLSTEVDGLRKDVDRLRKDVQKDIEAVEKSLNAKIEASENALRQEMASLHDKIVIKLGALMVTMTFLLLAIAPFYLRWVNALLS